MLWLFCYLKCCCWGLIKNHQLLCDLSSTRFLTTKAYLQWDAFPPWISNSSTPRHVTMQQMLYQQSALCFPNLKPIVPMHVQDQFLYKDRCPANLSDLLKAFLGNIERELGRAFFFNYGCMLCVGVEYRRTNQGLLLHLRTEQRDMEDKLAWTFQETWKS